MAGEKGGAKVKSTVVVPEELWIKLKVMAAENKRLLSDMIAEALRRYIEEEEKKKGEKQI
jgi:metal-responsive CopG/Arc/MetJ family transcriptional regulator